VLVLTPGRYGDRSNPRRTGEPLQHQCRVWLCRTVQISGTSNVSDLDRTDRAIVVRMVGLARRALHVLPVIVLLPYVACTFRRLQRADSSHGPMLPQALYGDGTYG
jgi:hypothetical protein